MESAYRKPARWGSKANKASRGVVRRLPVAALVEAGAVAEF